MGQNIFKNSKDKSKKEEKPPLCGQKKTQNEVVLKQLRDTLDRLKQIDQNDATEFETKSTRDLLLAIDDAFNDNRKLHEQITDILLKQNYLQLVYPFLLHYADQGYIQRQGTYLAASNILNTLWSGTSECFEFRKQVAEHGFIKLLVATLSDADFVQTADINDKIHYIILATLAIFHNISRSAELKDSFKKMRVVQIVKKFTSFNSPEIRALAYFFIANVATNDDDIKLVDSSKTIPFLIEILNEAMKTPNRAYKGADVEFPAHIIIESLHKLAVEDENRMSIFKHEGVRLLFTILKAINVAKKEQLTSANALWMLCYNETIINYVKENKDYMSLITKLAESSVHDEMRVACKGMLMLLNNEIEKKAVEYERKQEITKISQESQKSSKGLLKRQKATVDDDMQQSPGHIMISYNKFSRDVCLKIKESLDKKYDTWMDVECIYGDALDSMADAVERASVVLICMTENYKESSNCQIEAKYTLAIKKPYVPLKLQSKYQPRGWLGMLLNSRIFIDFADKPFEESMKLLYKEIDCIMRHNSLSQSQPSSTESTSNTDNNRNTNSHLQSQALSMKSQELSSRHSSAQNLFEAQLWKNEDLMRWLHRIKLDKYHNGFKQFDGKKLNRVYNWKIKESALYYRFISETFESTNGEKTSTADIFLFEEELEKLFNKSDVNNNC